MSRNDWKPEERFREGLQCFRLAIYNGCRWRYAPVGVTRLKEEEEEEEEEEEDLQFWQEYFFLGESVEAEVWLSSSRCRAIRYTVRTTADGGCHCCYCCFFFLLLLFFSEFSESSPADQSSVLCSSESTAQSTELFTPRASMQVDYSRCPSQGLIFKHLNKSAFHQPLSFSARTSFNNG